MQIYSTVNKAAENRSRFCCKLSQKFQLIGRVKIILFTVQDTDQETEQGVCAALGIDLYSAADILCERKSSIL